MNIQGRQMRSKVWFCHTVTEIKAKRLGRCWVTTAAQVSSNTVPALFQLLFSQRFIPAAHHLQHVWHTLPVCFFDVATAIDHPLVALKGNMRRAIETRVRIIMFVCPLRRSEHLCVGLPPKHWASAAFEGYVVEGPSKSRSWKMQHSEC